jgi:GT2 family glycosyltransferase
MCRYLKYFPKDVIIDFVFENCTDSSYQRLLNNDLVRTHIVRHFESTKKLRWPNTNDAIERFMQSECDIFLSPQDDMFLQDKFILLNLENLYMRERNVGIVGMRDGIVNGRFFSSCHSPGSDPHRTKYIKSGEYVHVEKVNDGPIALNKSTIKNIGLFDLEYWAHFGDDDYCFRCNEAGLRNFVMGAEVIHEKFGNVIQSEVWNDDYSKHDWEVVRRKWPGKM